MTAIYKLYDFGLHHEKSNLKCSMDHGLRIIVNIYVVTTDV